MIEYSQTGTATPYTLVSNRGQIIAAGVVTHKPEPKDGETLLPFLPPDGDYEQYWLNDQWHKIPQKPSEFHEFNWVTHQWEDSRTLADFKAAKNTQINTWRMQANRGSFTFAGAEIDCDALSRSDIDGVNGYVVATDSFPPGFPNAWKTADNSWISIPDVATWRDFYQAMVNQGVINFQRSEQLKAALAAATTIEEVEQITW